MLNNGLQLPTMKQICPECQEDWFEDLVKGREVECPYCNERVVPERGVLH